MSASVNLRTRPLRRSIYVPVDGECHNGKPTWAAEFQAAYYGNFLFNLHSGDRISIRIAASPSRHDRVVVSDVTEGRTRRIRGRAAAARHLDLDVGPLILRIHHRNRRSPLANFGNLRYGPTTINGRELAAYGPKGFDLVIHGHTRVKAGPIEHGHSFALTYAPW